MGFALALLCGRSLTLCSLKGPSRAVRIVTRDFTALDAVYYSIIGANFQQH
jgi:hypothetical protein